MTDMTAHNILDDKPSRRMIWLVALAVFALLGWASVAVVDKIVRGPGEVVPTKNVQVIQNLEGGIVSEILVREGEVVSSGQPLAHLDSTMFEGSFQELEGEIRKYKIQFERLTQELEFAETFVLPAALRDADEGLAKSETNLFDARRNEYVEARASFENAIALHAEKVTLLDSLVSQQLVPRIELINARQALIDAQNEMGAMESDYRLARAEQLVEVNAELARTEALIKVRRDQLDRTTIVAPMRAIVNEMSVSTIGGVLGPGDPFMELIPLEDGLHVETRIRPEDVAFLQRDMRATIKLTAYDYTIFGTLSGRVDHISADTIIDETTRERETYYKVIIKLDGEELEGGNTEIAIRPGMVAEVELHTGEQTVLQYLVKPLFKATEAFREQ